MESNETWLGPEPEIRRYAVFHTERGPLLDPGNDTFTINLDDTRNLKNYLQQLFTLSAGVGRAAFISPIFLDTNITKTIDNLAQSMTRFIRTGRNSTTLTGEAETTAPYYVVRWNWMIFPTSIILLGNALLATCIIMNTKAHAPLWKSSSLALLFHPVKSAEENKNQNLTVCEMEQIATKMRVQLTAHEDGGVKFITI